MSGSGGSLNNVGLWGRGLNSALSERDISDLLEDAEKSQDSSDGKDESNNNEGVSVVLVDTEVGGGNEVGI